MLKILRNDYLVYFLIMLVINTACTKAAQIQAVEYGEIDPQDAKHWRFHTLDNKTYSVTNFEVTDSTFVILEVYHKSIAYGKGDQFERVASSDLPLILHWANVKSVEKVEIKKDETQAATIVGGLLLTIFIVVAYAVNQIFGDGIP